MCGDCGQRCCQHRHKRSSRGTSKTLKGRPLAFRIDSERRWRLILPTDFSLLWFTRLLITMDSSKSIIVFICLWLILSCVLLDNSQGFEVRLSKTARRWKHKPRKTQENHQQYVKQMADLFSRFVVCIEGKNAFLFVCLSVCLLSRSVTLQLKECKTGAPNDGFLLNTLKTPFRLSRALLDI